MNEFFYILIGVLLIVIYHFLKRSFAKGKIIDAYIFNSFILLLIDYETSMVSRGGITKFHSYKFKKINLQKLFTEYEEKIVSFASDMLDGFVNILGMNERFSFIVSYNYDLIIFDIINGKILCNKKEIIKKNPNLKGFDTKRCVYSNSLKSVVIFDSKGYSFLLDTRTIKAEQINFDKKYAVKTEIFQTFDNLPSVNINKKYFISDPISFFSDVGNYNIDFISDKGSKRYFINIKDNAFDGKLNLSGKTFLSPKLMITDEDVTPLITMDTPSIMIAHLQNLNPEIKDIYISRVDGKGKEHWKLNISEITVNTKFSEYSYLYFCEFENKIYFIYTQKSSNKLSVSVIDKYTGNIIYNPKLFVNK